MRRVRMVGLSLLVLVSSVLGLGGCDAVGEVRAFREKAAEARDEIAEEVALLERAAADLPEGDPRAGRAAAAIDDARSREAAIGEAVAQLDVLLAESQTPTDTLSGVAHRFAPLLPEPFQGPVLLAAGLGVALFRANQLKRSAASIAASFQEVMHRDPGFRETIKQHADVLRSVQTPTARRIIDEATKTDRRMVKLPV